MRIAGGLLTDVRFAARALRATPIVTAAAVLSLALGIGANSAIFSLVDGLLLRPLPGVIHPEQLVTLSAGSSNPAAPRWPYAFWKQIQARTPQFGGTLAWSSTRFNVALGRQREIVTGAYASDGYFRTLGVTALVGRTFDETRGAGGRDAGRAVAVISHGFWQRRFGGSTSALGETLTIGHTPFTVVGVLPPHFLGTEVGRAFDIILPLEAEPLVRATESALRPPADRASYWLTVAIRLGPTQTLDAATSLVRGMQPEIRRAAQPEAQGQSLEFLTEPLSLTRVGTGTSRLRAAYQQPLVALLLVVALVLLLACTNIAHLQLARAAARGQELSVRRALGAGRWQLARLLLVESVLLAGAGAAGGLLFASWAGDAVVAGMSTTTNRIALDLPLDWRVLAFTMAVACLTALLSGCAPALLAGRADAIETIVTSGRDISGRRRTRVPGALVVLQVALSLVIVAFAGLFIGTFRHLMARDIGFDPDTVLLARVNAAEAVPLSRRSAFFHRLVAEAASAPGVASAAGSFLTPISGDYANAFVNVTGDAPETPGPRTTARWNFITPGWFSTYGMSVRAGRDFDGRDADGTRPVVIVNDAFVRKFFPSGNPIGRSVDMSSGVRGEMALGTKTIVGVVADAVYSTLREAPQPTMYFPLAQWFLPFPMDWTLNIAVRSHAGSPAALAPSLLSTLERVAPNLSIELRSLETQVDDSLAQERLLARLSGFFALVALLLAAVGLYGVTAYTVTGRRAEFGVRMALGARQSQIVSLALGHVSLLVVAGIALGCWASVMLSQSISVLLYGLAPRDVGVLAGAVALLCLVAGLASAWPAFTASRVDPASTLRQGR